MGVDKADVADDVEHKDNDNPLCLHLSVEASDLFASLVRIKVHRRLIIKTAHEAIVEILQLFNKGSTVHKKKVRKQYDLKDTNQCWNKAPEWIPEVDTTFCVFLLSFIKAFRFELASY